MPDETNQPSIEDIERAKVNLPLPAQQDYKELYEKLKDKFDEVTEDYTLLQEQYNDLKRRTNTHNILDKLIEPYSLYTFKFMCAYSIAVGFLLLFDGFRTKEFYLPDTVLNFLVGSTAATVIGLVGMVLTGVFISRPK